MRIRVLSVLLAIPTLAGAGTPVARGQEVLDWGAMGDEAVRLLQAYTRLDTTNPPGNETLATDFFAALLGAEGVPYEVFEGAPGRASIVARLRGDGTRGGAVVLLNHTDIVPADASYWTVDPLAGEILEGKLYGRGTTDMKGYGIVQFMAMAALQRARVPLGRDILFMATAAEETGGAEGAGFIVGQRPDLLNDVEYVLTEGGGARRFGGRTVHFVETTQKTPLWLRLRALGVAGHGSMAIRDSAANHLVRALDRIRTYRPEIRLVPPVAEAMRASARLVADPDRADELRQVESHIGDPMFLASVSQQYGNLLRNTIAITVIRGSSKTNVISPDAVAELTAGCCRVRTPTCSSPACATSSTTSRSRSRPCFGSSRPSRPATRRCGVPSSRRRSWTTPGPRCCPSSSRASPTATTSARRGSSPTAGHRS